MHFSTPLAVVAIVLTFTFFFLFFRRYSRNSVGPHTADLTVLVSAPLMALCATLLVSGLWQSWVEYQMSRDGRVTDTAVVRDRFTRTQPGNAESNPKDHTYVVFEFEDHTGRVWRVEREVEEGRPWSQSRRGDRVPAIEYLHGDPETWRFADEAGLWATLLLAGGAAGAVVVGLRITCGLVWRGTRGGT